MIDIDSIHEALRKLDLLNKQAKDILDCRIEEVLEDMSLTPLCELPEDEPIKVEKFLHLTETVCKEAALSLSK